VPTTTFAPNHLIKSLDSAIPLMRECLSFFIQSQIDHQVINMPTAVFLPERLQHDIHRTHSTCSTSKVPFLCLQSQRGGGPRHDSGHTGHGASDAVDITRIESVYSICFIAAWLWVCPEFVARHLISVFEVVRSFAAALSGVSGDITSQNLLEMHSFAYHLLNPHTNIPHN